MRASLSLCLTQILGVGYCVSYLGNATHKASHIFPLALSCIEPTVITVWLQDELPESLLGAVRLQNLDLSKAGVLDLETGHITRRS